MKKKETDHLFHGKPPQPCPYYAFWALETHQNWPLDRDSKERG